MNKIIERFHIDIAAYRSASSDAIQNADVLHSGILGNFSTKSMLCLYLFIEKYKKSDLKELSRLASRLEKDLSVVEDAVASPLLNGFDKGINSKLKMIKRTMYGCCGKELLTVKLIYMSKGNHG